MIKNYIKIAFRNIWRNKAYSVINILGLTLGITCSSMLFMLVIDELSFDSMFDKKDRLYRLVQANYGEEETRYYGMVPPPTGKTIAEDYGEVESCTRLYKFGGHINFQQENERHHERDYFFAEQNFFDLFNVEWIAGDPATALKQPYAIVIDEDWAMRLFGKTDVIGKTLDSGGPTPFKVSGVIKNVPQNSHLQYKILVGIPSNEENFSNFLNSWDNYGAYTYVLLKEKADIGSLSEKMPAFVDKYFDNQQERNILFQPLAEIHFYSENIEFSSDSNRGQIAYIYIFLAVGLFMLVIACINYMNLATAKSLHRGKEIGIRKVSGAGRFQLISQFLSESTIVALIALVLSIGLVDLLLPYFNELTDKRFVFNTETFGSIFTGLLLMTIVVGLLSGSYPAMLLSRLRPADILKGHSSTGKGGILLRKALVITQFTLSIVMIIATIIASRQLNYIQSYSLGFENDQMLIVDINSRNVRQRFETMKTEFARSPYVKGVAVSSRVPGEWKNIQEWYVRNLGSTDSTRMNYIGFDEDMLELYKIDLVSGANFSGNSSSDSLHVLINETAASMLQLNDPVGKYVEIGDEVKVQVQVIGVVKDFNFRSLHNKIGPIILGYRSNSFQSIDYFSIKFDSEYTSEVIAHASGIHDQFDTNSPIEYHFLDEQWNEFYKEDKRASNVFALGAGITIFIACLGLFGLASYIVQKRTKEISLRKVLGASVFNLFMLLSKTFAFQVIIAFVIAAPIAWFVMSDWLESFAVRFPLGLTEFAIAGVSALIVAIASVSYRVLKTTTLNPAETLRSE